jgi:hypothetical protein
VQNVEFTESGTGGRSNWRRNRRRRRRRRRRNIAEK